MTVEPQDHGAVAWSHILIQYRGAPILESFVKSLYQPLNDLHGALSDLLDKRTLDKAVGAQLDGIGEIVGIRRLFQRDRTAWAFGFKGQTLTKGFGEAPFFDALDASQQGVSDYLADDDYRNLIRFKISLNNGHATSAEIYTAMRYVFNATHVLVEETGDASLKIYFDRESAPGFVLEAPEAFVPRAAGVRLEMFGELAKLYFGFKGGLNTVGFGQAAFMHAKDIIN